MRVILFITLLFSMNPGFAQGIAPGNKAILKTNFGNITITLFPDIAPQTVSTFVGLAKGTKSFRDVKSGKTVRNKPFYKDMLFHKIYPKFVVQTGCPWGDGRGWPGFTIKNEQNPEMKFDRPYLVGLSKIPGQDHSGGSQFFITLAPQPKFNGKYTLFGEVVAGADVVLKISRQKRDSLMRPIEPIYLKEVTIE